MPDLEELMKAGLISPRALERYGTPPRQMAVEPTFAQAPEAIAEPTRQVLGGMGSALQGIGQGALNLAAFPGRVMQAGMAGTPYTTEQMVPWAAEMATNMVGAGSPFAQAGAIGSAGGKPGIRAYHGSPHDFERFDVSKIGTGEGAQAYGHGLYFAESEPVAKAYRDTLAGPHNQAMKGLGEGVIIEPSPFQDGTWRIAKFDPAGKMTNRTGYGAVGLTDYEFTSLKEATVAAKSKGWLRDNAVLHEVGTEGTKKPIGSETDMSSRFNQVIASNPGRMYEVNIKAQPEQFLDWDKPLSEQSPHVQEALRNSPAVKQFLGSLEGTKNPELHPSRTGESIHDLVGAAALREAGIPGIRYLDQGSRAGPNLANIKPDEQAIGKFQQAWDALVAKRREAEGPRGTGDTSAVDAQMDAVHKQMVDDTLARNPRLGQTSNYVVFNDQLIDILKKYGLAGLFGAGAYHGMTPAKSGSQ